MIKHIDIKSLDDGNSSTFKTSPEVIQKVMNVPMCAVMSILRSNGYSDIHDETSLCIDEERLGIFTEAYVRKMKNYFTRSLQNISSLPRKERSDYNKFVKLFKKKGIKEPKIWKNDIDIDHLKEVFVERIKEETEERYSSRSGMMGCYLSLNKLYEKYITELEEPYQLELLGGTFTIYPNLDSHNKSKKSNLEETIDNLLGHKVQLISEYTYKFVLYSLGIGFIEQEAIEKRIEEEKTLLNRISDSELYIAEPVNDKPVWCGTNLISRFVSFARYYIYSVRDDEDSHSADINFLRFKFLNINNGTGLRLCS